MSVSTTAESFVEIAGLPITNSMLVSWLVTIFLVVLVKLATKDINLIPSGLQNLLEWFMEGLYNMLEEILGKDLVKKSFWFFFSLFIFIMFSNWSGLIPLTGHIFYNFEGHYVPLFRPGSADVSYNLAMALSFMVMWIIWGLQANGGIGFIKHIFAPKGKFEGVMLVFMVTLSIGIGFIEIASIIFRPISLSLRLYGNVFAGENIMHAMGNYGVQIPFYFMELMVGVIQALVFTMLCAVFTGMICEHEHDEEHEH